METQVYSLKGEGIKTIELSDVVFAAEISDGLIYHAIRNELANRRVGTASAKTRAEVAGSGKKPWRQKGTGRARAGHKRSPVWVGGGIVFGPKPRDYSYSLPKKMKRGAYRSLLSLKLKEEALKVVENFSVASGKTKEMSESLSVFKGDLSRVVLIVSSDDVSTKRAGRNLPWLSVFTYDKLSAHDLFYADAVLVQEDAAVKLNDFLGKK
ncbi:50S ribosomal protein L4 [Spirochaetia bacterium 38H-sp]|uniref:Large ribosomal subunit protein uL4 n=1 Tax=Rarispira pelagica TaxID=3141764 RepID=A0ABU9UE52_9SPIR